MATPEAARRYRQRLKAGEPAPPRAPDLPWPRTAEDGTPLGVDLSVWAEDLRRIMLAHFRSPPGDLTFDEYYSEVCLRVLRRNRMPSAHDPRKSSTVNYLCMQARQCRATLAEAAQTLRGGARPVPLDEERATSEPVDLSGFDAVRSVRSLNERGLLSDGATGYAVAVMTGAREPGCLADYRDRRRCRAWRAEVEAALGVEGAVGP